MGITAAQTDLPTHDAVYWTGGDPRWKLPDDLRVLTTTERADVCIVGGGFSGLWTALSIKAADAAADVVLVEQRFCGAGASGRNGGWVNGWDESFLGLVARFGADSARWLAAESVKAVESIAETVREKGIECDLAFGGGLVAALSDAQHAAQQADAEERERLGAGDLVRVLSADEAREMCGSPFTVGGVIIPSAGSVQPALLALGLRRLAVEAGVRVFECTPMTYLERGLPATVETPSGTVVADKVVLTCGPWMATVPDLRRTVFVIPSHVVATAPDAAVMDGLGWATGRPFSDNRTAVHYAQRTGDARMVFGRGGGRLGFANRIIPAHFHDRRETREIVADLHQLFPAASALPIEWAWGGPVERSQHGFPWVGSLGKARNVHYAAGYGGNGVGPSRLIGRTLASVALGLSDEYASSPLVSDPPTYLPIEPFRFVGARAVRTAVERCEVMEDEGRQPDRVSDFVRRGLKITVPKGIPLHKLVRRD
jgi:glycine/D-amino acid oxidase-like deaminating enzyme